MTDGPRRWRDEGELPPGLREALDAGQGDLPSEHELRALEASVLAAIAGGGGGGSGGGGAAAKAAGAGWAQAAGVLLVVAAGTAVVWSATRPGADAVVTAPAPAGEPAPAPAPEPAPVPEPPPAPEPASAPEPAPEPDAVERRVRARPALPPPEDRIPTPEPAPAIDELALLRAARSALGRDPAEALALTDRMASAPVPAWAEERERIAIEALDRLGRAAEARARLDRFVAAYPRSAYRARLEEILAAP